jgi:SPP1 family predicted phage head-tail adaptor
MAQIPIGAMRQRISLQAAVEVPDGAGGVARTYAGVATLWAAFEPLAAGVNLTGEAPGNRTAHRVTLRWRDDVTTGHRVVAGARTFEIRSLFDPDGRKRVLVLTVESVTS